MEVTAVNLNISVGSKQLDSRDPEKNAKAVSLVYVRDNEPGIRRMKGGKKFRYVKSGASKVDPDEIERIKKLAIPPAWEDVWICALENGHLQATGFDSKKRKQYRYHLLWNTLRNHTKYFRLLQFGKSLPGMRLQLEKDISLPGLPREKVLALILCVMERTNIRVGNYEYEKLYGSFGLTTLKDNHVAIDNGQVRFSFKGKKGIHHDIRLKNRKLAKIIKACRDIPGKELFQYYTEDGERKSIDSGTVNNYIREISGEDFTAKDFRTWSGTIAAFLALKTVGGFDSESEAKAKINSALEIVSAQLGNTRNVCKKYYVHPLILSMYENKTLDKYLSHLNKINRNDNVSGLTSEEKIVMQILEFEHK